MSEVVAEVYCPYCGEDLDVEYFDHISFKVKCLYCDFEATYENVDKSALILREIVDDIQKQYEKEIKASPVDWSQSRSYPMPSEDQIVKGGSHV